MEYQIHTLRNGMRIVHAETNSPVAHCAVMIEAGSRDESPEEAGVAHLIEHLLFKGTQKRKAFHILSRLEDVGGEINAYTTKEETCVHASFLKEYYERTLELFGDILFHSTFLPKALLNEKEVILEEINSYRDTPSEQIFDDFDEMVFTGHPLGKNILGDKKTLKKLKKEDIERFISQHYHPSRIVIASVGAIAFSRLIKLAEKYFQDIGNPQGTISRIPFSGYLPQTRIQTKNTHQAHCIIGNTAYHYHDRRRFGLFLLTNLLGGPGMNTRLNMALREKNGLVYTVEASYQPYIDTGIFTIYFGADNAQVEKSLDLIHKELDNLRNKSLGTSQLKKAKQQLIGQLAIASDSGEQRMMSMAKSLLVYDEVTPSEEIYKKIEAITAQELMDVARDIFSAEALSMLTFK